MRKISIILLSILLFSNTALAESYHFKGCKLSNVAWGDYVINIDKKVVQVTLMAADGRVQKFSDKISRIEKNRIITEKIESGKGDQIYFEYYLDAKTEKITKLQYKRQSGPDIDIFMIQEKKESPCSDVKGGWNADKIEKVAINEEQEQILKTQELIKKKQSSITKCKNSDHKQWSNCKGLYKVVTGHTYDGLFRNGQIIEGTALFPGGAKYVGEFKDFKPNGYGTFVWANGDKYVGEWKDGKTNGNGTKVWKDGREYLGTFKNDKLHGKGTLFYPDGKKYVGEFLNGKRHGEGTFSYSDGSAYIGQFINGKQQGEGECVNVDGLSVPCESRTVTQKKDFSGKDTKKISIVSKKWVRISQYETNTKKGKKIMDKLKIDFDTKALEICALKGSYNTLDKKIEILEIDETPAYGLETKLKIGISGVIECI